MQTISSADKALLDAYSPVHLHLYIGGVETPCNIGSFSYQAAVGSDSLDVGNAVSASIQIVVAQTELVNVLVTHDNKNIITHGGNTLRARTFFGGLTGFGIGIKWDVNGSTQYDLFQGTIEKCAVSGGRVTITAQDALFWSGSRPFSAQSNYQSNVSAQTVLSAIASGMGVTLDSATSTLASGVTISGGFSSCREILSYSEAVGYVAGILGGNAVINRAGKLAVVKYASTSFVTEPYSGGATAENRNYAPTGVSFQRTLITRTTNADGTVSESERTRIYVAGDGSVYMDNPLANQTAATTAYNAIKNIKSRKGSFSFPMGVQLEPGDVISITSMDGNYPVAIVSEQLEFDGGVKCSVVSAGQSYPNGVNGSMSNDYVIQSRSLRSGVVESEQLRSSGTDGEPLRSGDDDDGDGVSELDVFVPGRPGPFSQRIDGLALELLKVKNLQAENAEITSAKITELFADWANIGTAVINTLIANGVSAQWMKVTDSNGNIIFSADQNSHSVQMGGWTATKDELSSSGGGNTISLGNGQISANVVKLENSSSSTEMPTLAFYPRGDNTPMLSIAASGNSMTGYWASFYSPTDLTLDSNTALVLQGGAGSGPSGYSGVTIMGTCNHWGGIYPGSTESYSLGSSSLRWNNIYAKSVNIGGYNAIARRNKTVTGTTAANGNISLGLNGDYGILYVRRTDAASVCVPYWSVSGSKWYCHILTNDANQSAVASTSVTLDVDYYAK